MGVILLVILAFLMMYFTPKFGKTGALFVTLILLGAVFGLMTGGPMGIFIGALSGVAVACGIMNRTPKNEDEE